MNKIVRLFENEEEYNSPILDKISHITNSFMEKLLSEIEEVEKEKGIRIHRRDLHYVITGEVDSYCIRDVMKRKIEIAKERNKTKSGEV